MFFKKRCYICEKRDKNLADVSHIATGYDWEGMPSSWTEIKHYHPKCVLEVIGNPKFWISDKIDRALFIERTIHAKKSEEEKLKKEDKKERGYAVKTAQSRLKIVM